MQTQLFANFDGALLSPCNTFRYLLWRTLVWPQVKIILWIMLNPSTADASVDDQTIRKVKEFTRRMGGDMAVVANLYAWRATDPMELLRERKDVIVGPDNDRHIRTAIENADMVICAWGSGKFSAYNEGRVNEIMQMLKDKRDKVYALKINKDGTPAHPLMLPYSCQPVPYARAA